MKRYQIQSINDWKNLKLNDLLTFKVVGRSRTLRVEFNASHHISVFGSYTKDMKNEKLMVSDRGLFTLIATVSSDLYLRIVSDNKSASVVYKNRAADHLVQKMSDEKFTGIEMRRTRDPQMERLMYMVKNAQSEREAMLLQELGRRNKLEEEQSEVVEKIEEAVSETLSVDGKLPDGSGTDVETTGVDTPPVTTATDSPS